MRLSSNMAAMLARKFILPQAKDGQLCPAPPQPGAGEFSQSPKSISEQIVFCLGYALKFILHNIRIFSFRGNGRQKNCINSIEHIRIP